MIDLSMRTKSYIVKKGSKMARFHVGRDGNPKECTAEPGKCPLGGEHYGSMEECEAAIEKNAASHHSSSSTLKKQANGSNASTSLSTFSSIDDGVFHKDGEISMEPGEYVCVAYYDYEDDIELGDHEYNRYASMDWEGNEEVLDDEPTEDDSDEIDQYQHLAVSDGKLKGKDILQVTNNYYTRDSGYYESEAGAEAIALKKSDADELGIEYEDKNVVKIDSKQNYPVENLASATVDYY